VRERWLRMRSGCGRRLAGLNLADEVYGCVGVCFGTGEETSGRGCGGGKGLLRVHVCAYWSCSGGGACWDVGLHVVGGGGEDGEIRVKD
jgi:hypothetical protein